MPYKLALLILCCALGGCELVANFDRTKISEADAGHVSVGKRPDAGASKDAGKRADAASESDGGANNDAGR